MFTQSRVELGLYTITAVGLTVLAFATWFAIL